MTIQVITLLGISLYALARITLGLFYGPFHVTPEDVGLGYAQTLSLTLSAVAIALLVIAGFLLLAFAWLWTLGLVTTSFAAVVDLAVSTVSWLLILSMQKGRLLTRRGRHRPVRVVESLRGFVYRQTRAHKFTLVLLVVATCPLYFLYFARVEHDSLQVSGVASAILTAAGLVFILSAGVDFVLAQGAQEKLANRRAVRRISLVTLCLVLVVVATFIFILIPIQARRSADLLTSGHVVNMRGPFWQYSSTLVGSPFRADPAIAHVIQPALVGQLHGTTTCVLYLGTKEGVTYVYQQNSALTFRLPQTSVTIETGQAAHDYCGWPR